MATRFYFPSTGSAAVSPTISGTDWMHINTLRLPLKSVKGASTIATTSYSPDAADHLVAGRSHLAQFVSDVLPPQIIAAQTVTIQARVAETIATNNLFLNWKIYAVNEAGDTVLGTLLAVKADATEVGTSLTNRRDTATTTAFTATNNFRLVVEVGLGGTPSASGGVDGHNGSISLGESATDLPEDDSATGALNPWLQFSDNLKFGTAGANIAYTFVDRCEGGGHFRVDLSFNGNALGRFVYTTDEVREPLANLSQEVREAAALIIMKLHMQGKTRAQIVTEFNAGPVTVII